MPLVVGTNSYVTEEEASAYCSDRYGYEAWDDADDKDKALISATDILDGLCIWHGEKLDPDQLLEFPRYPDWSTVPLAVKDAQCEIAFAIITNASVSTDGGDAIEELKAGDVSFKFKARNTANPLVNNTVLSYLRNFGYCSGKGTKIIPVTRG
jgi:hypothetical protein